MDGRHIPLVVFIQAMENQTRTLERMGAKQTACSIQRVSAVPQETAG